ncbi:hypothetical protein MLD38_026278 [Melastoma candidum]|uniref:Uncharacterized protein n=1 Tax=Melastoma candidum TaxID=119954 RepID=A0ACB9P0X9_9MYRT|nr:hypothetical protein MLD38_026278 [Melastoma candidum]
MGRNKCRKGTSFNKKEVVEAPTKPKPIIRNQAILLKDVITFFIKSLAGRRILHPRMESLSTSIVCSYTPPSQNLRRILKFGKPTSVPPKTLVLSTLRERNRLLHLLYPVLGFVTPLPGLASEPAAAGSADKINLEAIVVAIDDFFTRNPFFVAGCTFIWLVVLPVVQYYVSKYKYVSAVDAFRKLRDDPDAELLDIRDRRSVTANDSPDLGFLKKKKGVVKAEFVEGREEEFVRKVLGEFEDPGNTVLCILDNFDGNSLKVAELLFKKGFKEAYAIKGGVLGKKGWMDIQETLLPPSAHMKPKKKQKGKPSPVTLTNGAVGQINNDQTGELSSADDSLGENLAMRSRDELVRQSLSPYPNYPDLKPPSSPTPSRPEH